MNDAMDNAMDNASEETILPVYVNNKIVRLQGKERFMFVDIFDFIDFDLSRSNGRTIVTKTNGIAAEYTKELRAGDRLEIFWQ